METNKSIYKQHHSDIVQNQHQQPVVKYNTNIMSDYACNLKENINLEKQVATLTLANENLATRIASNEAELKQGRDQLQANEERMETLQKVVDMRRKSLDKEQAAYKIESNAKDVVLADLQDEVIMLRKKLRAATGALDKSQLRLENYRERCCDYKDKLRSFAILFTYFNDPKRSGSARQEPLTSDSNATYESTNTLMSSAVDKNDQSVQLNMNEYYILPSERKNIYQKCDDSC